DVEIIKPERVRDLRRLRHHAAARHTPDREDLVRAHRPHVHGLGLGPAEQPGIERKSAVEIARVQLVPADMTGRARRCWRRRLLARSLEQDEPGAVRVGGHGETVNVRYVAGFPTYCTIRRFSPLCLL